MKKIFFLIIALMAIMSSLNIYAQAVYRMTSHGFGRGEYLDNLRNADGAFNDSWGIRFSTADLSRAFISKTGQWGFLSTNSSWFGTPATYSEVIRYIQNLTLGVEGWVCTEGLSIRLLDPAETNTLDILNTGNKNTITSNGDSEGLHIQSANGHKIYLYNKVYFDDQYWTSIGAGRNNDPTINNSNNKMLRIGSNGGIGIWGASGVDLNDSPQFYVSAIDVQARVPMSVQANQNVKLLMGYAASDNTDAWMGAVSNSGLHLGANNSSAMYIGTDRNIYAGLTKTEINNIRAESKTKYSVFVAKGILSEDLAIAPQSAWADFVFNENYHLRPLSDVERFIKTNKHLPDVPSAREVAEKGYSQHDFNKTMLQKVEELTLYVIDLQKQVDAIRQ